MNSLAYRILELIVVAMLLSFPVDFARANAAHRGRVGILNIMDLDAVHLHFGLTRFGGKEEKHVLPNGPLPAYINVELKKKLSEFGYEVLFVESSLPREDYPGYLVSKGWRDLKLTGPGKAIVKDLVERENLDFVVLLEDFARSVGLHPGTVVSGHGLYTKAYIGDTNVPTSRIFGGFIGAVVSGSTPRLLGTSAPPYMTVTEVNSMDADALPRIEAEVRSFADQVVAGLVMYLDGTFE